MDVRNIFALNLNASKTGHEVIARRETAAPSRRVRARVFRGHGLRPARTVIFEGLKTVENKER
jgi:hypothetical protein